MEIGRNKLCFLDLKLTLKDNEIQTKVYTKRTDSHLYLKVNSYWFCLLMCSIYIILFAKLVSHWFPDSCVLTDIYLNTD